MTIRVRIEHLDAAAPYAIAVRSIDQHGQTVGTVLELLPGEDVEVHLHTYQRYVLSECPLPDDASAANQADAA